MDTENGAPQSMWGTIHSRTCWGEHSYGIGLKSFFGWCGYVHGYFQEEKSETCGSIVEFETQMVY